MDYSPNLIVMLTYNDYTVENANEIFTACLNSKAKYWGFKEEGLPLEQMKQLCGQMNMCGKTTCLEVVSYTEEDGLKGAKIALECGFDILMGTMFFDTINEFCKEHGIKYIPYVGCVYGRPSVLSGNADDMIAQANSYLEKGVYGINLLAFRYDNNPIHLIKSIMLRVHAPICIAGSVNSFECLDEIKLSRPWAFTIGSAFFDKKFGSDFKEQVDKVYTYVSGTPEKENLC